jgi:hypothetical protein
MRRAHGAWGGGFLAAIALCACGSGGPPDEVPFVRTGGSRTVSKTVGGTITSGERLGNPAQPSVSQSGTEPTAGTGNDLTGAGGAEAPGDSDFIGVDEFDTLDDFQDVRDFANLDNFAAGFVVPGLGAAGAGAVNSSTGNPGSGNQSSGATTTTTTTTSTSTTTTNAR